MHMTISLLIPPLQVVYLEESDPRVSIGLLIGIVVLITIIVIVNIFKNGISGGGSGFASGGSRKFSRWALKRAAAQYGLGKEQNELLESIFRKGGINDPESALRSPQLIDRLFKRTYREIEKSSETEQMAEYHKALLFSIRSRVDASQLGGTIISSTHRLADNMAATLSDQKENSYPIRIISAKGDQLITECPKNAVGTIIRFSRGAKVKLSFYAKSSQGYRIETRVIGMLQTPRGPALQLSHTDKVSALPNRRFKRIQTHLSCFFSYVRIEERMVGRKKVRKSHVDDRHSLGTILDISAGGCAIKSAAALANGSFLKIEFEDIQDRTLAVLGRVIRTNRTHSIGGIMHIQFVKVPRKSLNAIQAMVYEYDQD